MTNTAPMPEPLTKACAAYQTGALAEAGELCQEILGKHRQDEPIYLDAVYLLASVQVRSGRLKEALASFDTVLSIRPQLPDALNSRGNILKAFNRFEEALADYDRALAARPDFVEALNNRGNLLLLMKRFDEALASYDRALAIRPRYELALSNRGNALNALRRFDEAIISFDQALVIKPDFVPALNNRGLALAKLHRFDEALASCKQSLALQAGNAGAVATERIIQHERALFQTHQDNDLPAQRNLADTPQQAQSAQKQAALASRSDLAEVPHQRATIETELPRLPKTFAGSVKAQDSPPEFAKAFPNEVERYLLVGDFRSAWWRYDQQVKSAAKSAPSKFLCPQWDGLERLFDRTILRSR